MPGKGLQEIPLRVPDQWDPAWFTRFVREVLALADIRNAVEGTGVTITGNSSQPATIAADASIAGLLNVPFVTLSLSSQLTAERVLTPGTGIALTDGGAGSTITVSVDDVPYSLFGDLPGLSVLGNQLEDDAQPGPIIGTASGQVLRVRDIDGAGTLELEFGKQGIVVRGATWVRASTAIATPVNDVYALIAETGTIRSATILTQGGPGSCVIDVRKVAYASFPPAGGDSIVASAPPTITADIKSQDTTLTGWDRDVEAGDVLGFHITSTSNFTYIQLLLEIEPA